MGADRAASSGKSRGCGPLGGGQPTFRRSGSLDCACRGAVARPSRGFREVELSALSPMGQGWRVRSDLRGLGGRCGFCFAALRVEYVIVDGTIVRVHQHGTGAKGGTHNQAIGRSRGGLTIVALVDALGNLVRFVLLPGQRHDSAGVAPLLTDLDFAALLADKAFDSDGFRTELDNRGAVAVIPPKANRVTTIPCDFEMYKWRHLVENFFCKIKEFRRIATRYDKTDTSFAAMIHLVGSVLATR